MAAARGGGAREPVSGTLLWRAPAADPRRMLAALAVSAALHGALLAWAALLVRDRARPAAPAFMLPLAVYAGATLVSAAFSLDPMTSVIDSKQLVLLLIVPMVYQVARGRNAAMVIDVILAVGAASAACDHEIRGGNR